MPIPCQAINHFIEGVETIGGKMDFLNNQLELPAGYTPDEIVRSLWKHKANINDAHRRRIAILKSLSKDKLFYCRRNRINSLRVIKLHIYI
jgi:hypothetical protein